MGRWKRKRERLVIRREGVAEAEEAWVVTTVTKCLAIELLPGKKREERERERERRGKRREKVGGRGKIVTNRGDGAERRDRKGHHLRDS